jgi:hypothetical protein
MARALDYMKELARDPEINPEVARTLRANGWHLRPPTKANYDFLIDRTGEPRWVGDLLTKDYPYDHELWTRFYLKVGWCFACRELGRANLIALGGQPVLSYLTLAVDPKLVAHAGRAVPDLVDGLFRDVTIGREQIWFWKATLPEVAELRPRLPPELGPTIEERARAATLFGSWVRVHQTGQLRRREGGPLKEERVHKLRLTKMEANGRAALGCSIDLFGGVMSATAQLTIPMAVASFPQIREVVTEIPLALGP